MQLDEISALTEIGDLLDLARQSDGCSESTVTAIVEALHAMADRYSDAEYQGVSDALVLLAELVDPLQHDEIPTQGELLANTAQGLQLLVHSPETAVDLY